MSLTISIETPRQDSVIRLLDMSSAYAESLYPSESNHILDLQSLEQPDVTFWVARIGSDIVGCCALVDAGDGTAEIKRMFVDPAARGRSVARKLMETIEAAARERRLSAIRLETGIYQPEGINLYKRFGYMEISAFGSYAPDPLSLFMEKTLI